MRTIWIILSIPLLALSIWFIIEMAYDIRRQLIIKKRHDRFMMELDEDE